jgi:hypothetical protein
MRYGPKTILAAIDWWQREAPFHPLTCGNDSQNHSLLQGKMTPEGKPYLECPDCDYLQLWVPDYVVDAWLEAMSIGVTYMATPVGTFTRAVE